MAGAWDWTRSESSKALYSAELRVWQEHGVVAVSKGLTEGMEPWPETNRAFGQGGGNF